MSDLTKYEILYQEAREALLTPTQVILVKSAMDLYADQEKKKEAIAFKKWCDKNANKYYNSGMTTEWIYDIYLNKSHE